MYLMFQPVSRPRVWRRIHHGVAMGYEQKTNWLNLLRLEMNLPLNNGKGAFEAATLHVAKSNDGILGDWQDFSNIEADINVAAIAVLG